MDRAFEEERLQAVRALIQKQLDALTVTVTAKRSDVTEARRGIWAETHVVRDFDDLVNLSSLMEDVTASERSYADASLRVSLLKRMLDAPYFGRIDFAEDGYDDTEAVYIGGQSLFDDRTQAYYVYDWRAPISSMYYDYGVGRASFDAPDGVVSGEITLKRQYRIEKGELIYCFDADLAIDDEILQYELSKASDAKIKTIINSIQREQNRAIRHNAENILVFGPAGSGKTSVGLHRLAYLLYRHKGSLTSARVRIFSTNNVFATYIAGVIPALGEEDVVSLDFKALMRAYAPEGRVFLDAYEQIDCIARAHAADALAADARDASPHEKLRIKGIVCKYDPVFAKHIENYVRRYQPSVTEDACFNRDVICTKERIIDLYSDRTVAGNLTSKTSRVLDFIHRCYEEYFRDNKKAITAFFNDLYEDNFSDGEVRGKFDEQKSIVLNDLRARLLPDTKKLYEKALRSYAKEYGLNAETVRYTLNALRRDRLLYEDALVMFYIDALTGRVKKDRNVRHILVDEAQDLSYLQHRILRHIFEGCHFTVLADINQALYPYVNLRDKETLLALYGGEAAHGNTCAVELSKSYRSTYEISRFAAGLLGTYDESVFYRRFGGEPEVIACEDAAAATVNIIKGLPADYNTVGVLLSDRPKAEAFHKRLPNTLNATLINDADDGFVSGVMVMAVPFAKGLEFDAVIVPEYNNAFDGEWGRRLLYLICTRALHRLYLLHETPVTDNEPRG